MPEKSPLLRTKDVLEATGITHQILYRYVTMGLIEELEVWPQGKRSSGAAAKTQKSGSRSSPRRFPAETIAVIKLIQSLNQSGYTLRDIKDIFFKEKRLKKFQRRQSKKVSR